MTLPDLASKLTERARRALRFASVRDGHTYVDTFAGVPARFIDCQVWGLGDRLNADGLALRSHLMETKNGE
jgi:hypothetical protein